MATRTTRVNTTQPNQANYPNGPSVVEAVVRFLRTYGLDRAEWSTDLVCYVGGRKVTRAIAEQDGHYDMKCHWYELEQFIEEEIGMFDPMRPRRFSKERPVR